MRASENERAADPAQSPAPRASPCVRAPRPRRIFVDSRTHLRAAQERFAFRFCHNPSVLREPAYLLVYSVITADIEETVPVATTETFSEGRYRFGELEVDFDQRRVVRGAEEIKLTKLTFLTLRALASAEPRLITKEELARRVWGNRIVTPDTIAQRVKLLRRALNEDPDAPQYVEVVHGQGYRWIAPVERRPPASKQAADGFLGDPEAPIGLDLALPDQPSVVVLPFDTLGDNGVEHRVFADGLTHDIITNIGRARWLYVVARGSAFMFRGSGHIVQEVGRKLGVRYVAQGSVCFSGPRIKVNAAIADAVEGKEIWAESFRGEVDDVFVIQEEIASAIVGSFESEIEYAERKRSLLKPVASLDAWSAYHRAWWHLNSYTADCCDKAEQYFQRSMQLDPQSARAPAGMSCVHWLRAFLEITDDRAREVDQSLEFAQTSVALDARDPLAHWALGRALHLCHDFGNSVREYEISNQLNPNFALGQFSQAFAMMHVGDFEKSNELLEKARRRSPYDTMTYAMLGVQAVNCAMLEDYDRAADLSVRGAKLLAFYCQMFPVIAAYCNALAGRDADAARYYRELQASRPGYGEEDYFRAFPHQRGEDIARISGALEKLASMS